MAVPGADRRKSIDGHRSDGADSTTSYRLERDGLSPASCSAGSPRAAGGSAAGLGPFADNTGKREVQVLDGLAETDDWFASEPPAIEVVMGRTVVAEQSDEVSNRDLDPGGSFGGNDIYLHYLEPDQSARSEAIVERAEHRARTGLQPWWSHGFQR